MTQVELMTVLAIGGILLSVGFSVYSGQTHRLRTNEAVAEMSRIQLAIAAYSSDPGRALGSLPESLAELGLEPALLIDPWGRPYRYAALAGDAAGARRDGEGRPLNRDFDLYSLGRDGATEASIAEPLASDDILRAASGGYIGSAAEFAAIGGAATGGFAGAGGGPAASESGGGLDPRR